MAPQAWPPSQSPRALRPPVQCPLTTGGKGLCVLGVAGKGRGNSTTVRKARKAMVQLMATRLAQALALQVLFKMPAGQAVRPL